MRWDAQRIDIGDGAEAAGAADAADSTGTAGSDGTAEMVTHRDALPGLGGVRGLVRTVTTPDFAGVRFHEVLARSALNEVPRAPSYLRWTINPYRGCTHACVYCFARPTHAWLELDTGLGFDREIVVKTNLVEVLRRELARGKRPPHVALGTNTDPYQRAEGRYRLLPGVIEALGAAGVSIGILTKGTLLRRDLPLLTAVAPQVPVSVAVSLAHLDSDLRAALEPGAPTVEARLGLITACRDAGFAPTVLIAPVLPYLTDDLDALDAAIEAIAAAGARRVSVMALHLKPYTREWFFGWLTERRPDLLGRYERLYARGAYVPKAYRSWLARRTRPILTRHGVNGRDQDDPYGPTLPIDRPAPAQRASPAPAGRQLSLLG